MPSEATSGIDPDTTVAELVDHDLSNPNVDIEVASVDIEVEPTVVANRVDEHIHMRADEVAVFGRFGKDGYTAPTDEFRQAVELFAADDEGALVNNPITVGDLTISYRDNNVSSTNLYVEHESGKRATFAADLLGALSRLDSVLDD